MNWTSRRKGGGVRRVRLLLLLPGSRRCFGGVLLPPYVQICIYTFKNVDFHSDKMLKQFPRPNLSFGLLVLFLVFFHNFTIMVRKYYGVRDCFDLCSFIIILSPFYFIMTNKWLLVGCLWIAIITSFLEGGTGVVNPVIISHCCKNTWGDISDFRICLFGLFLIAYTLNY